MKHFLFTPVCAIVALVSLNSCQNEDKSATELTTELTAELQKVVSYETAQIAAPRVEVLNKRFQDALVRVFAANGTPLLASAARPSDLAEALGYLGKEMGRVKSSKPTADYASPIDRETLLVAIGRNQSDKPALDAAKSLEVGEEYFKKDDDKSSETPGNLAEYYGSDALGSALSYTADTGVGLFAFGEELVEVPEEVALVESSDDAVSSDEESSDDSSSSDEEVEVEEESSDEESGISIEI